MIKITSIDELHKIDHLPQSIQESIINLLQAVKFAPNISVREEIVVVIEKKEELNNMQEMNLKYYCTVPSCSYEIFCTVEIKYVQFFLPLNELIWIIFYIPREYVYGEIIDC